jgi:hypothetical protein
LPLPFGPAKHRQKGRDGSDNYVRLLGYFVMFCLFRLRTYQIAVFIKTYNGQAMSISLFFRSPGRGPKSLVQFSER